MSHNEKSRSRLSIDAVVQAAAPGSVNKLTAIAGLAGFVLRLFRSRVKQSGRPEPGSSHGGARIQPGTRSTRTKTKGGRCHG